MVKNNEGLEDELADIIDEMVDNSDFETRMILLAERMLQRSPNGKYKIVVGAFLGVAFGLAYGIRLIVQPIQRRFRK